MTTTNPEYKDKQLLSERAKARRENGLAVSMFPQFHTEYVKYVQNCLDKAETPSKFYQWVALKCPKG